MAETDTLDLRLKSLGLNTMKQTFEEVLSLAQDHDWSYRQFLQELCERESHARNERKLGRLLKQSRLPEGKSLASLQTEKLPGQIRKILPELISGRFIESHQNILAFGLPGRGKTHLLCALARELILKHRYAIYFSPTFKIIEGLLLAKNAQQLENHLKKLDKFDVIILDDIGYVQHTRCEMEVLFTFLAERYERKSLMISSNLIFSKWDRIFQDPMTAMAAIDRLVHHSIILEFSGESYRQQNSNQKSKNSPP